MEDAFRLNERTGRYLPLRSLTGEDIIEKAKVLLAEKLGTRLAIIQNPEQTKDFLRLHLAHLEHEVFAVMFLDNRHRVIAFEELFRGTIDSASVYPREVVKAALKCNAAAVIFAHNHPSGVPEPSPADRAITQRLRDALALVEIRVLDHFVVGGLSFTSFAEKGLL